MKSSHRERSTTPCLQAFISDCLKASGLSCNPTFEGIIQSEILSDRSSWLSSENPRLAYLMAEIGSKHQCLDLPFDRRANALRRFEEGEDSCRATNHRLGSNLRDSLIHGIPALQIVFLLRRKIGRILPDFSWDDAEPYFDFGPGATDFLPRKLAHLPNKIGLIKPTVTSGCHDLAVTAIKYYQGWSKFSSGMIVVPGNRVTTVPKSYKTDRTIAIEPLWNMFFQKGIGGIIRRCLLRSGCDLNDQRWNQAAAFLGSKDGTYATLDLSNASDSVSMGLVDLLLPRDWVEAIALTRSPVGTLPSGRVVPYQKVSSMGNGYTFELESLLFFSMCLVANELTGSTLPPMVYGDDLAVCPNVVPLLSAMLEFFGFSLNLKKSCTSPGGGFRESCGKHFLDGADITPFYVRRNLTQVRERVLYTNNLYRFMRRDTYDWHSQAMLLQHYWAAESAVPDHIRSCSIPDGMGDGGIVRSWDTSLPNVSRHRGQWDGWVTFHYPEVLCTRYPGGRMVTGLSPVYASLWRLDRDRAVSEIVSHLPQFLSKKRRRLFVPKQWVDTPVDIADVIFRLQRRISRSK